MVKKIFNSKSKYISKNKKNYFNWEVMQKNYYLEQFDKNVLKLSVYKSNKNEKLKIAIIGWKIFENMRMQLRN